MSKMSRGLLEIMGHFKVENQARLEGTPRQARAALAHSST
jgi:hypothetical protein